MDPAEFLFEVWAKQGSGFGFISLRKSDLSWYDMAIKFPEDKIVVPDVLEGDLYFTPNLFSRPRRRKGLVLPSLWLYADLDQVDPRYIDEPLPTIAWESSPGRYQCLWLISRPLEEGLHSDLNKRLTYKIGADKGGWDSTQVLRIPGTINHKYNERPGVKLLWP